MDAIQVDAFTTIGRDSGTLAAVSKDALDDDYDGAAQATGIDPSDIPVFKKPLSLRELDDAGRVSDRPSNTAISIRLNKRCSSQKKLGRAAV